MQDADYYYLTGVCVVIVYVILLKLKQEDADYYLTGGCVVIVTLLSNID